jgi:hypothetical protein
MSVTPSIYETYIKNMINDECASVAYMDCKYREIAYIRCMNQSNENSRYCNYMSDILRICCKQPNINMTQMPAAAVAEPVQDISK